MGLRGSICIRQPCMSCQSCCHYNKAGYLLLNTSPTFSSAALLCAVKSMMLDSRGDLAAVVLALWCPLFLVALWVVRRHGFGRQAGWIFIVFLAAIRITGSSMELASESMPQTWLIVASAILQSVGLSPLLFALLGILSQVYVNISISLLASSCKVVIIMRRMPFHEHDLGSYSD